MSETFYCLVLSLFLSLPGLSQEVKLSGKVSSSSGEVSFATLSLENTSKVTGTDSLGRYSFDEIPAGEYTILVKALGYHTLKKKVHFQADKDITMNFLLVAENAPLDEVVVTGTMKEVTRLASPVPVEVYSPAFFKKNPTPSIFDALQNVNGVRPQLNCNVCNTGDIHINGLEGPYTMILIDGMPIVSGLSSVYGLSGIPNALIERVEIVKGPASSLYGSEAVGGLINIITKKPQNAASFSGDVFSTSWGEVNTDIGLRFDAGRQAQVLTGINYFKYGNRLDKNNDNFTDVTLQDRISIFQKWNISRKENRILSFAGRYNYEDRWGGDMTWDKSFRGGTDRYGESIFTNRWELLGNYQLPTKEPVMLAFSANDHRQNSVYGDTEYHARQSVGFAQLSWQREIKKHSLLLGTALRATLYDDNTPATFSADGTLNQPEKVLMPGIFVQDEITFSDRYTLLLGMRYDYNSAHGNILTPRVAAKWKMNDDHVLRLNAGTGFRVVSLFTEEHAALTGSRTVVVAEEIRPERSYNANLNYNTKLALYNGGIISMDASAWYTHFSNQILPDYDSDPSTIIYSNLTGFAVSRGLSMNIDLALPNGLTVLAGGTLLDVYSKDGVEAIKTRPYLTEKWSATWSASYKVPGTKLGVDYTGNVYGPMRLPLLGETDPRNGVSPVWSLQNVQLTYSGFKNLQVYGGVKNLLNWTPGKGEPFLIARSRDPFNKEVQTDSDGRIIPTPDNPYGLSFDPTYVYAPNQGIRGFLGIRLTYK